MAEYARARAEGPGGDPRDPRDRLREAPRGPVNTSGGGLSEARIGARVRACFERLGDEIALPRWLLD